MPECCTTSIEYEPRPSYHTDSAAEDIPWLLILPFILLVAALIWLWSLAPDKPKPVEKTLREEIDGVFAQLTRDAALFKRDEAIGPLNTAQQKISDILAKRKF